MTGFAVVEVYFYLASVEQVILNGNGSIHKSKGSNAKANGKDDNGDNAARQPFSGFGFRHFPHPPYAYGLQAGGCIILPEQAASTAHSRMFEVSPVCGESSRFPVSSTHHLKSAIKSLF